MGIPADSIANPARSEEPPLAVAHAALLDIMSFWEDDEISTRASGEMMYERAREALESIGSLPPSPGEKP